jgi:exosortase/archaeosortase family protein
MARLLTSRELTATDRARLSVAVLVCLAVVLLTPREPLTGTAWADAPVAGATTAIARLAGLEVERAGPVLRHPGGFAMEIYWRCTGLLPAGFLAAVVLASPGPLAWRLGGAAAGAALVMALNLARLLGLFVVGAFRPDRFSAAHDLGELSIVLSVPVLWLSWVLVTRWRRPASRA